MPAVGIAGGILFGINSDIFEVISWNIKSFYVSTTARIKSSGVVIRLTTVYIWLSL
jgi:hypothetical protein